MGLRDVVDAVRDRRKTLTVFNPEPGDGVVDELAAYFADYNLEVRAERTDTGRPEDFAVLDVDGVVLATVPLATLRDLVADVPEGAGLDADDEAYRDLFRHFSEATFTSYDRSEMLSATREIEDRVARVGAGELFVGFQRPEKFRDQLDTYRDLGRLDVDVTVFVEPAGDVPSLPEVTVVERDDPDVRDFWFLAFDGGDALLQQCALVAEERDDGRFFGFWTYDPDVVERVFEELPEGGPSATQ